MSNTTFIIIRHGETQWNLEGKVQGQLDSPLTETGIRQAQALAKRLQGEPFDQFYSSDLGRCRQTAEIIAAGIGQTRPTIQIQFETCLRERKFGILEGLTWPQVKANYPAVVKAVRAGTPDYTVPGGENYHMILNRLLTCLERLAHKHPGERILVVSHGGVLGILFKQLLGIPLESERKFRIHNAGLNVVVYTEDGWQVETLGDISHLKGLHTADEMI